MSSSKSFCFYYCTLLSFFGSWFLVIYIQTYLGFLCAYDSKQLDITDKPSHALIVFLSGGFYHIMFFAIVGAVIYKNYKAKALHRDTNVYELLELDS